MMSIEGGPVKEDLIDVDIFLAVCKIFSRFLNASRV